jgi:hypothetical protein
MALTNECKLEVGGIARCSRFNQFSKATRAFIGRGPSAIKTVAQAKERTDERRLKQLQLCGRMCRQPPSVLSYFSVSFIFLDLAHVNDCGNL